MGVHAFGLIRNIFAEGDGVMPGWDPLQNTIVWLGVPACAGLILSLQNFSKQKTASRGNLIAIISCCIALVGSCLGSARFEESDKILFLIGGLILSVPGMIIGAVSGIKCGVSSLPKMIALFNALGALSSTFLAMIFFGLLHVANFYQAFFAGEPNFDPTNGRVLAQRIVDTIFAVISLITGFGCFTGSMVAVMKMSHGCKGKPMIATTSIRPKGALAATVVLIVITFAAAVVLCVFTVMDQHGEMAEDGEEISQGLLWGLCVGVTVLAGIIFIMLAIRVAAADMSILISILNAVSGWAAGCMGVTASNSVLVVSGAIVGTSGMMLAGVMCQAMNVTISKVFGLEGLFQKKSSKKDLEDGEDALNTGDNISETTGQVRPMRSEVVSIKPDVLAEKILAAKSIMIVPGFGLSVCHGQFILKDIVNVLLRTKSKQVTFAIHPVAGRLPGHMNMILAEAGINYNIIKNREDSNAMLQSPEGIDLVLVVGACDVCNPGIVGMPSIDVWDAREVCFVKRSLSPGFSGIPNPTFYFDNTVMCMGDSKEALDQILMIAKSKLSAGGDEEDAGGDEADSDDLEEEEQQSIDPSTLAALPPPIMCIGVPKELPDCGNGASLVALSPAQVPELRMHGIQVKVQAGAGLKASFTDKMYQDVGAVIVSDIAEVLNSDIICTVNGLSSEQISLIPESYPKRGCGIVGPCSPAPGPIQGIPASSPRRMLVGMIDGSNSSLMQELASRNIDTVSFSRMPRTSQCQFIDALSTLSNISGYSCVTLAANLFNKLIAPKITASGDTPAAKALVIGCGVAGLAAVGTLHDLKAVVYAFDLRPEVKDQIQSCGGKFICLPPDTEMSGDGILQAERKLFMKYAPHMDIIISTASIPGRPAPKILMEEHVRCMKPGSVIIDMAAPSGGNCIYTKTGSTVRVPVGDGASGSEITVCGETDLVSRVSNTATILYGQNISNIILHICRGEGMPIRTEFDINASGTPMRAAVEQDMPLLSLTPQDGRISEAGSESSSAGRSMGDSDSAPIIPLVNEDELSEAGPGQKTKANSTSPASSADEKVKYIHPMWSVSPQDSIMGPAVLTHNGQFVPPPPRPAPAPSSSTSNSASSKSDKAKGGLDDLPLEDDEEEIMSKPKSKSAEFFKFWVLPIIGLVVLCLIGIPIVSNTSTYILVFVLAAFIGWGIVRGVHATLHTPLMSLTNAMTGVLVVGSMDMATQYFTTIENDAIYTNYGSTDAVVIAAAVLMVLANNTAWINAVGGFTVTQRCLNMVDSSAKVEAH